MTNINARGPIEYAQALLDPAGWMRGGGELAILNGKPVLWAGPGLGWQSPETFASIVDPETFRRRTGAKSPAEVYAKASFMPGFDPDKAKPAAPRTAQTTTAQGTITPGQDGIPPAAPTLPPPPNNDLPQTKAPYTQTTIPQEQDTLTKTLVDYLKELADPERIRQVEDMRLQNLLKSQLLTSELTRSGERARFARDIERENIQAWKEKQVAQIQANAVQQAALGASMISAFAPPAAQALTGTLQAAMQPFANVGLKRG